MKIGNNMIRYFSSVLMAGVILFGITACGETAETQVDPAEEPETEQYTAADEDSSEADAEESMFSAEEDDKEDNGKNSTDAGDKSEPATDTDIKTAADSDVEAVPYLEFDYKTLLQDKEKRGDKIIYKGSFESPVLSDASALTYPALAETLEKQADAAYADYQQQRADFVADASERYGDDPDYFDNGYYENYTHVWLRRADDKVMSYVSYYSNFEGGAHGMYGQNGYTYETETGKQLGLKDVLKDTSKLNDILEKEILENYDKEDFEDLKGHLKHFDPDVTEYKESTNGGDDYVYPYEWCLLPIGIEFYFEPYSLSYYAAGEQDVLLTYEDYPDLFVEEYKADGEQGFTYDFLGYLNIFDITGDGKRDSLWVEADDTDDQNFATGLTVGLNGKKEEVKDVTFYNDGGPSRLATYIRTSDGRQYIYTEAMVDDIYDELFVFDLNKGKAKYVDGTTSYMKGITKLTEDFIYYRMAGIDPERIELFKQIDILVTFDAKAPYHVGKDGMPERDEPYKPVYIPTECTLKSKTDLTCDIVDEDGNVLSKKEKIKSGETFYIVATDDETYVDAKMSDGRIARLNVTSTKYPCEIDGVPADECFEKLFYAG